MQKLYQLPLLYDIAFQRPLVGYHIERLIECHSRFRPNQQLERVLELAAGPGRHALEFAARGYKTATLDYGADMCAYVAELAKRANVELEVFQANMRDFTIPHKYDLAMILLNSIGHLYTEDDLFSHLNAMWRHLNTDGIYVIEAHFPPWTDRESIKASSWNLEGSNMQLQIDFGTADDEFDPVSRIRKVGLRIHGTINDDQIDFSDALVIHSWSGDQLESVIRESDAFEIIAKQGSLDPDTAFDTADAARLVYVLRKKSED